MSTVEPGIYPNGQIDYDGLTAVRQSTLKHLIESGLLYKYRADNPIEPTAPMLLGTAAHKLILEPEAFAQAYALYEGRRYGKDYDAFVAAHPDLIMLKPAEYEHVRNMALAVKESAPAADLRSPGEAELSIVWRDADTQLLCKGRPDWITDDLVCVELKTTGQIAPGRFRGNYARLMYHMQAAFYGDGYEAVTGKVLSHRCVSVEQHPPYDVVVYEVPSDVIDLGRAAYRELLGRLAVCMRNQEWLGYAKGRLLTLQLPEWAAHEADDVSDLGLE